MKRTEAERIAISHGWLAGQPRSFQPGLLRRAELKHFDAGAFVYHAGDDPGGIYGIVRGAFAIYLPLVRGGTRMVHIARTGVWFGQGPMNIRRDRKMSFRASEEAAVLHVSLPALNEIVARDPMTLRSFGALTEINLEIAATAVRDLLIRRADQRIAATLLRVTSADSGSPSDDPSGFSLTQSELGEMANASRDLVNRTLAGFEARGWISKSYNRIAIGNLEALAEFAHGEA